MNKEINFMGSRKIAGFISVLLVICSIATLSINKLQFGLDFTGGTVVEVQYAESVVLSDVRDQLAAAGYGDAIVQNFGSSVDVLVRIPPREGKDKAKLGDEVFHILEQNSASSVSKQRVEYVGPQVGDELAEQGGLGMLFALGIVMLYVAFRFQLKFAVASVIALAHDVIIALGIFSFFGLQFDLTVLAAVLAVIGYSLNDTIVVSDRIRENFRMMRKGGPVDVINHSLTQTLGRTLMTSMTTLLVLTALFVWGGDLIHSFALALIIGVFVGTYSSIYVAANILLVLGITKEDLMLPEKEGAEIDEMP